MSLLLPKNERWSYIHSAAAFALFGLALLGNCAPRLWEPLYPVYYKSLIPVFLAFYLYFRRLRDGWEMRLLLLFGLWLTVSRILLGDESLRDHQEFLLGSFAGFLLVPAGLLLPQRSRLHFLDGVALVYSGYMAVLALLSFACVITGLRPENPFSGELFCQFTTRLHLFNTNPNTGGSWFMAGFLLCLYLLFRNKLPQRIAGFVLLLPNYLGVALCTSRNTMLCLSLCMGLLVLALLLPRLGRKPLRIAGALLLCLVIVPLFYKSFDLPLALTDALHSRYALAEPTTDTGAEQADLNDGELDFANDRGLKDSGRLPIYRAAILSLKDEPLRLLLGCHQWYIMDPAAPYIAQYLSRPMSHLHSSYLQVLHYAGLPGLLLVLAFLFLLVKRMLHALFLPGPERMSVCCVSLLLLAAMGYSLLECCLFWRGDLLPTLFFLCAGVLLGCCRKDAGEA